MLEYVVAERQPVGLEPHIVPHRAGQPQIGEARPQRIEQGVDGERSRKGERRREKHQPASRIPRLLAHGPTHGCHSASRTWSPAAISLRTGADGPVISFETCYSGAAVMRSRMLSLRAVATMIVSRDWL